MAKILVIRLTSLGDVIFTLPLVNTLKDEGNEIGYLVAEKGLGVIQGNPSISKVHFVPLKKWKKRPFSLQTFKEFCQIIKEIRTEKYDIALDCHQMFKNLFLFLMCGAKRRITFKDARELSILGGNEFVEPKAKFRDFNYHIVERNLDFARHLGIEPSCVKFSLPDTSLDVKQKIDEITSHFEFGKPIVVLSPATTWENKHWEVSNWSKLAQSIDDRCNLVFTGTSADVELVDKILSGSNRPVKCFNLVGKTKVEELRELFSRSKIVVSPDSGSAHLAWASSIPAVISIFTCTPSKRFGPYGNYSKYFALQGDLACQPCFKKKCKLKQDKNICQQSVSAELVIDIVNKLLN